MKKIIVILTLIALFVGVLGGCANSKDKGSRKR